MEPTLNIGSPYIQCLVPEQDTVRLTMYVLSLAVMTDTPKGLLGKYNPFLDLGIRWT